MQCAQCVRAVCTVGACVQHGMCTGHTVHTIKSRGVIHCYFLFSLDALAASSNISLLRNSSHMHSCSLANTGRVPPICGIDNIALRREVEHQASCIMDCNRSRIINHHNGKPNHHLNGEMGQAGKK